MKCAERRSSCDFCNSIMKCAIPSILSILSILVQRSKRRVFVPARLRDFLAHTGALTANALAVRAPARPAQEGRDALRRDVRKRASVIREVAGVQHLNTGVLFAIERRDNRVVLIMPRLAAQFGRYFGVIEPEAEVILMGCREGCRAAGRDGECLDIEDAAHAHAAVAVTVCLQIALIPGDAKGLVGKLDDKEVIASVGGQAADADGQLVVQAAACNRGLAPCLRQAGSDARRGDKIKVEAAALLSVEGGGGCGRGRAGA